MKVMNLSEIMDKSIDILRKNIKTIVLFSFGYGVIALIGIVVAVIIGVIMGTITAAISSSLILSIIVITILVVLIMTFIFSYYIGIIKISSQEFTKERVFAHTAIKASFKYLFKVLIVVLIGTIAFVPIIAAFGWFGYLLFTSFDAANIAYGVFKIKEIVFLILLLLYLVSAIFISLAFLTWFSFSLHTLVIEKHKVFKCIKKSFYLVKKEYWKVFGSIVLFTLTVAALRLSVDLLLSSGSSLIFLILKLLNFRQDFFTFISMIYSYANWPLSILLLLVITPIGAIMLTMLYFNQRFKKEGFDLELRLNNIQIKEERKQLSETTQFNGPL